MSFFVLNILVILISVFIPNYYMVLLISIPDYRYNRIPGPVVRLPQKQNDRHSAKPDDPGWRVGWSEIDSSCR